MKQIFLLLLPVFTVSLTAEAQINIGSNQPPDSSAMLQISGTTKGFLPPRMSHDSMLLINNPAKGLLVFNTTDSTLYMHRDSGWMPLGGGSGFWLQSSNGIFNSDSTQNVGIGTSSPVARLQVIDSNVVFSADGDVNYDSPGATPINGEGRRMMWYPDKASFRAGIVYGDLWNADSIGYYSFAAGADVEAKGDASVAMGYGSSATGYAATALGEYSVASGEGALATGQGNASGTSSFATNTLSQASGYGSSAFGYSTVAQGNYSVAMGISTTASNDNSMAIGSNSIASGTGAFAAGHYTQSTSKYSVAMGSSTIASADNATALGNSTTSSGNSSFATGYSTKAQGDYSFATGNGTVAGGNSSAAMGNSSTASADYSNAFGYNANATGPYSFALGVNSTAGGVSAMSMGNGTTASGDNSNAFGYNANASGQYSFAIGLNNTADGLSSVSIGNGTSASANYSNAFGYNTSASGQYSFAIGVNNNATGLSSVTMGNGPSASGDYSNAFGYGTTASSAYETVIGKGNTTYTPLSTTDWNDADRLFTIGNGNNFSSDAIVILKNGNTGIGTSLPIEKLVVDGNIVATGTITGANIINLSDARFKKDIQPLSYSLDAVMKLKAVSWHWKTAEFKDRGFTNDKQIGFIAQDIEKVVPEVVLTDAKGYKGIDYAKLTAVFAEAIKAQQLEIERLQQQVSASGAQQQTIDALTQRLDKLEQSLAGKPLERTTVKKETK